MRTEQDVLLEIADCEATIEMYREKLKRCHYSEVAFLASTIAFAEQDLKRLLWFLGKTA